MLYACQYYDRELIGTNERGIGVLAFKLLMQAFSIKEFSSREAPPY